MQLNNVQEELVRIRVVLLFFLVAMTFLGCRLWSIQVVHSAMYEEDLKIQSIRYLALPGARGMVYDRNGTVLAENRPSYNIVLRVQELREPGRSSNTVNRVESVINTLAEIMDVPREVEREDTERHIRIRRPLPFVVWRDISQRTLARWEESVYAMPGSRKHIPGVDVVVDPVRVYPNGNLAAHVLGYVSEVKPDQDEMRPYDFYLPEMKGKSGIEGYFNDVLSGEAGWNLIEVDASGFKHSAFKEGHKDPERGRDVTLTIDVRVQKLAEELIDGKKAAVVVIDPRNGEVLVMASAPTYDSNLFSPRVPVKDWKRLNNDLARPLINRAIYGAYPPGSTFKPVVSVAAIQSRKASGGRTFNCKGAFYLGSHPFRCWRQSGHGWIAMRKAIEQSCNAYFCQLGLLCGHERIISTARSMGLDKVPDIELYGARGGLIPDDEWKGKFFHDSWRPGDTCNMSIGQGAVLATPLQMAVVCSTIANGGYLYKPTLVRNAGGTGAVTGPSGQGSLIRDLEWSGETRRIVRGGMRDVVQAERGTGKRARIDGVEMAGKTGTAEYGKKGEGKKHTWMLFFAPFDNPRYAGAIIVEDGISGGISCAPLVKKLMTGVFEIEKEI